MKKLLFSVMAFAMFGATTWSQVAVGTTSPDTSAAVHIETEKPIIIPRVSTADRDANIKSPSIGVFIFNTTESSFQVVISGSQWHSIDSASKSNVASGTTTSTGKVGIGTSTPDDNAVLEISATNKGFLLPRMASDPVSGNVAGMIYYNTTVNTVRGYNGTSWIALSL